MSDQSRRVNLANRRRPFLFSLTIRDGENDYLIYHIIYADSEEHADELARRVAEISLGSKMRWNDKAGLLEPATQAEHRLVEYHGIVGEATSELIFSRLRVTDVDLAN